MQTNNNARHFTTVRITRQARQLLATLSDSEPDTGNLTDLLRESPALRGDSGLRDCRLGKSV